MPKALISLVDAIDAAPGRNLDVGRRQHKLADRWVQSEDVGSGAHAQHHAAVTAIHAVTCRHHFLARLHTQPKRFCVQVEVVLKFLQEHVQGGAGRPSSVKAV